MRIIYDIRPKSHEEYCDVIDAISEWLDRNNIEHKKSEILEEGGNNANPNHYNLKSESH